MLKKHFDLHFSINEILIIFTRHDNIEKKGSDNEMSIKLEVWGDYALFSRPEFRVERVSYDVMTPSAARGILDAIMWHPGLRWIVDCIHICSPIQFFNIRRNEVKSTISARNAKTVMEKGRGELYIATPESIQQRASMILRDVHYIIEAHFEITEKAAPSDNPGKFQEMMKRRINKGQYFYEPYFGCREFPVHFSECESIPPCPAELRGIKDLGYMFWDMDYSDPKDIKPLFFRAVLQDGLLTIPTRDSGEVIG